MAFNYDESKDKKLAEKLVPISEIFGIIVSIYSCNGADPTLRFSGYYQDREGNRNFGKVSLKVKYIEKITKAMEEVYNEFKQKSSSTPEQSFEMEPAEDDMPF
jgi:hypothetical protein